MKIFAILLVFVSLQLNASAFVSVRQALDDVDQLCSVINGQYAYLQLKQAQLNFSWNDKCKQMKRLINEKGRGLSRTEFAIMITDLMGVFKDSHTNLRSGMGPQLGMTLGLHVQHVEDVFWLRKADATVLNQLGLTSEQLESQKLVLESLQGIEIKTLATKFPFVGSQSEKSHYESFANRLNGQMSADLFKYLSDFKKEFVWSENIKIKLRSLITGDVYELEYPWVKLQNQGFVDDDDKSCIEQEGYRFKKITDSTYYLFAPTWQPERAQCYAELEAFLLDKMQFLKKQGAATNLIIDVRGNGGGSNFWQSFVRQFLPLERGSVATNTVLYHKPAFNGYHLDSNGVPHRMVNGVARPLWFTSECKSTDYKNISDDELQKVADFLNAKPLSQLKYFKSENYSSAHVCFLNPVQNAYRGRVAVLVDRSAYSSNEQFLSAMKAVNPAQIKIVGEPSRAGSGGGGEAILEQSQFRVSFSVFANWNYKSELIEGVGMQPDVAVSPTIDSILSRRDLFVDESLKLLESGQLKQ